MNRENDLRERYIYAATRGLPRASRADIEQELRTLIDDLLEEQGARAANPRKRTCASC